MFVSISSRLVSFSTVTDCVVSCSFASPYAKDNSSIIGSETIGISSSFGKAVGTDGAADISVGRNSSLEGGLAAIGGGGSFLHDINFLFLSCFFRFHLYILYHLICMHFCLLVGNDLFWFVSDLSFLFCRITVPAPVEFPSEGHRLVKLLAVFLNMSCCLAEITDFSSQPPFCCNFVVPDVREPGNSCFEI